MTQNKREFKRTSERQYSAHHTLLHIAALSLERAEKKEPGWFNDTFVALTFAALAVEAMANAIGDKAVPDWKDFESASPMAKLRILAERLDVSYDSTCEPWETIRWLGKLRNQIAHPKPERIIDERLINEREKDDRLVDPPESKIERQITIGNARRALKAVVDLKWLYCNQIPAENLFGLSFDGWSGSTELVRDI